MSLVTSLLTAIVRADGDALVLHAGERPYVVAPSGQSELASRALTLDAMRGMIKELLPADAQHALVDIGAVQHELAPPGFAKGQRFTVIAARGGDDIWIEIRRHRAPAIPKVAVVPPLVPVAPVAPPPPPPEVEPVDTPETVAPARGAMQAETVVPVEVVASPAVELTEPNLAEAADSPGHVEDLPSEPPFELTSEIDTAPLIEEVEEEPQVRREPQPELALEAEAEPETWNIDLTAEAVELETAGASPTAVEPESDLNVDLEPEPVAGLDPGSEVHEISLDGDVASMIAEEVKADPTPSVVEQAPAAPTPAVVEHAAAAVPPAASVPAMPTDEPNVTVSEPAPVAIESKRKTGPVEVPAPEPRPAIVVPLARTPVRTDPVPRLSPADASGINRLLRIAAAGGASTLYLMSQARPSMRVDGGISPIDGENALAESEVEALILELIPERNREAFRGQAGSEWICDVPDVGRVQCMTFRDHRGAGGIFRMLPERAISVDQLGLSREIQGLCAEADGLVLVAGPRSSGKSTLVAALVDVINRTRSDHVITIENQINFVHENRRSLVSQREVRGDREELLSAARLALRENPDVLVIEEFGSPDIVALAIEAAQSGQLVIGALTAHTVTDAVNRLIEETPADRRQKVQTGLAEHLRGIVAQVLLRRPGGGRVAAREILLNTRAVSNVIAEGRTSQLPMVIDNGRKHGMVALNDVLAAYVQDGIVDSREAYRRAADHQGFLALLERHGIDTSFVERLA